MPSLAIAIAATTISFLAMDGVWLGVVAQSFYKNNIGHLLTENYKILPAIIFYCAFMFGIAYFALSPALAAQNWKAAIGPALVLGFVAYGAYDFTNWAVMRDWPAIVTFVDVLWGVVATTVAATIGAYAGIRWGLR
ncbi:MAG: DUF2177 family protein [Hyphomicrobiales bacterium]|nr:DUF2177 family protein [Hyphomicrobiales bacterium]